MTNVGSAAATYTASFTGMAGFNVVVSPSTLTLNPGQTKILHRHVHPDHGAAQRLHRRPAHLDRRRAQRAHPDGRPAGRPRGPGPGRPAATDVTFGYDGPVHGDRARPRPGGGHAGTVADDPTDSTCSLTSPNAQLIPVTVPAGTTYARFSLFDADVNAGSDLDLCVFNSAGTQVGSSGSGTSAEEVNLLNPAAGTYTVVVQGWGVVGSTPVHAAHLAARLRRRRQHDGHRPGGRRHRRAPARST